MRYCLFVLALAAVASCSRAPSVHVPADYATWNLTTDRTLDYPIPGHMDHLRRIYINPTGEGATTTTNPSGRVVWDYPPGTIIVKEIYQREGYDDESVPNSLTVMIKASDHPRARKGWVWLVTSPGAEEATIIDQEFCVTCHADANERHPYGDANPDREFRDCVFFPVGAGR